MRIPFDLPASRRLNLLPLIGVVFCVVCGGAYGLEPVVAAVGGGWAIALIVLAPLLWRLPIALMVAELTSAMPEDGGYYVWVRTALGDFWGVQEAWWTLCYTFIDVAIYPEPLGTVVFRAAQHTADKLTSITHQVSTDNIHYQSVAPDQMLTLAVPYWYRAVLTRLDSNFDEAAAPVDLPGDDPGLNPGYSLQNTATTDLGGGIIERTLNFSTITGPVQLEETPLDGTLVVFDGTVPMPIDQYTVVSNEITLAGPGTGIMIRYQTSAFARAGLPARKNFYSPYLFEVRFERL